MLEKVIRDNLLAIIAAWCKATDSSLSAASKKYYGNGTFFDELKRGERTISLSRLSQMLDAIREEWPEGTRWPPTRPIFMALDASL